MLERSGAFLAAQVCVVALSWTVWADEVPDDYLPGAWAIGDSEACGTPAAEHITFDSDGTFKAVRGEQPTATGFWHLVEDVLDLHMVSSPAFFDDPGTRFDDALSGFAGQYQYFYAKALLFDIAPDGFRAVATMGNTLRGANYNRCP